MRRRSGMRGAVVAFLCAVALVASACTSARSELGTRNGDCFVALPAAHTAVRGHGHLVGELLVTWGQIHADRPYRTLVDHPAPPQRLCLVAFGGRFERSAVQRGGGHERGRLAIVVVEYPQLRVVATMVVRHPPGLFGHSHLLIG